MNKVMQTLLAISIAGATFNSHASTTLRLSHFWPAESKINKEIFEAWSNAVEEDSEGEIKIQNFPSETLSQADKSYQGAVKGISDIAITAQGYTAGRFPLTQIVELPGMVNSAQQGSCMVQTLYDEGAIKEEYKDSHVLFLFTHGPGYLHLKDVEVKTPKDFEGLRVRRPTAVVGSMLESMGAQPIGMPMPEVYTALQRGVMDGLTTSWEGVKVFGLNDIANSHTQVPLYTLTFVATMNERVYQNLSPKAREAIDNNSGMKWSSIAGEVFDQIDKSGKQEAVQAGHAINVVDDPLGNPEWSTLLKSGIQGYLTSLEDRGVDGVGRVYKAAQEAKNNCASS
ncbi:TRAP transporter substrate-binding protein [Halomonas shantousis]